MLKKSFNLETVFVDMDNTLIDTQALYEKAHEKLAAVIMRKSSGLTKEDIIAKTREIEIALYPQYGYKRGMLPHAFADTLKYFIKNATERDINTAQSIAENVYTSKAKPKRGAMKAIRLLSKFVKVCLLTVGDETVQRRRINALSCRASFHKVFVVDKKDKETFEQVLAETHTDANHAAMVGDSLKSDIIPAVQAGLDAFFIPANNWAAREMQGAEMPKQGVMALSDIEKAAEEICGRAKRHPHLRQQVSWPHVSP